MAIRKKTGGRKRGTPNKVTADIRALAQAYGADAIEQLARLMTGAESEVAQIAAAKELLDRGYGKSRQAVALTGENGGPVQSVSLAPKEFEDIARRLLNEV